MNKPIEINQDKIEKWVEWYQLNQLVICLSEKS